METGSGDVVKVEEERRGESGRRSLGVDGGEAIAFWEASKGNAGGCACSVPTNRRTIHAPMNGNFEKLVMKEGLFFRNTMQGPVKVDIRKKQCK